MVKTKLFYIICSLLLIVGCKDNTKVVQQKLSSKQNKQNSILKNEESLSVNIWKGVKFGMTKDEVAKTKTFGDLNGDNNVYTIDVTKTNVNLGIFTRELGEVRIAFGEESGKLNFIHFLSKQNIYADHIDDMEEDCHKIVKVIEEGFKTKLKWENYSVDISDFNEGKRFDILNQIYGDANIIVSMGKKYEGSIYYYEVMASYNNPDAY